MDLDYLYIKLCNILKIENDENPYGCVMRSDFIAILLKRDKQRINDLIDTYEETLNAIFNRDKNIGSISSAFKYTVHCINYIYRKKFELN